MWRFGGLARVKPALAPIQKLAQKPVQKRDITRHYAKPRKISLFYHTSCKIHIESQRIIYALDSLQIL
ncbi:hypothetical protein BKN38_07725 [Helicobacter sp. CLO-3]|nr:hypothetical protein BA723_09590 [Helicobacter sp. CLO-3]OHU82033.1 hypothetical protein BKN38_07725 [Helicobacter sp. CLO-3]